MSSSSRPTRCTPSSLRTWIKLIPFSVLVAYGDTSHPIPKAYLEYANTARENYLFGQYTAPSLPSIPTSPSLPAVVLYKSFDEGHAILPASDVANLDAIILADFVKLNSVPLMDEISPENFGSYAEQGLPIAYLFLETEDNKALRSMVDDLTPLAKEYKGQVNFVYIDSIKFVDHGKSLGLSGDSWPAFVVQDLAKQTKFPLTESVSRSSVEGFMKRFVKGEIHPSIKSAPVPKSQDGPVYHLVADGWDELFEDEERDVFAEFFAPWCGHCRGPPPPSNARALLTGDQNDSPRFGILLVRGMRQTRI